MLTVSPSAGLNAGLRSVEASASAAFFFRRMTMGMTVELRGPCPKDTVDVIDAVAHAKRLDRTSMVNRILAEWAEHKILEAKTISRVMRGNPESRNDTER